MTPTTAPDTPQTREEIFTPDTSTSEPGHQA